jgi:hypothetical protein
LRAFQLRILQEGADDYGVVLEALNGGDRTPHSRVAQVRATQTRRILPSLLAAVRAAGHAKSVLSVRRTTPLPLSEESGVRLALVLLATHGVRKPRRVDAMTTGIEEMSTEEAYYWYAKCLGDSARRMRRALRLFLAAE